MSPNAVRRNHNSSTENREHVRLREESTQFGNYAARILLLELMALSAAELELAAAA